MTIIFRKAPPVCTPPDEEDEGGGEDEEDGDDVLEIPPPDLPTRAHYLAYRRREFPEPDNRLHFTSSRSSFIRWFTYLVTDIYPAYSPPPAVTRFAPPVRYGTNQPAIYRWLCWYSR